MLRRQFLQTAAVMTAAANGAFAAKKSDRIRCGILGIDHAHALDVLKVLQQSPDFDLAGVCEPDAEVRKQFSGKAELRGTKWLSQDELLGDPEVRMIAVESGVPRLLALAGAAANADKHIHLDKAAGTDLNTFRALLDELERRERLLQMGYMFRYNPGFDLVRRAVKEDWLGRVYSVQASMCTSLTPEKRKRSSFHPGGMMLELGCHLIDMMVLLFGPPKKVTPFLRHDGEANDALADNTCAVFEYDHMMATVESAAQELEAFPGRRFKVCGPNGSITLSPLEPPAARVVLREARGELKAGEQQITFPDLDRHVRDFADFAQAIRGEKKFEYTKQHDFSVQQTVLRACGVAV